MSSQSNQNKGPIDPKRRRRINRLKKMIVTLVILCLSVPTVLSTFLLVQVSQMRTQVDLLEGKIALLEAADQSRIVTQSQVATDEAMSNETAQAGDLTEPSEEADLLSEEDVQERRVYLTFDDGPSYQTDRILDILELYDAKATFFVVGKEDEHFDLLYQRIVKEGHSLGMHSYSHQYASLYESTESFASDLDKIQDFLYDKTGVTSSIYRFPGGSSNTVVTRTNLNGDIDILRDRNIQYFDWNVSSGDASGTYLTAAQIADNVLSGIEKQTGDVIVLLHDAEDKKSTIEALPQIIEGIRAMDHVTLSAITEDTTPIQHYTYEETAPEASVSGNDQ